MPSATDCALAVENCDKPMYSGDSMSKKHPNRADLLAGDLISPRILSAIDKALQENGQERLDLLDLRKMAVRRHGETPPALMASAASIQEAPAAQPNEERLAIDGTVRGLISSYQSDPDSPYQSLRYRTKEGYKRLLRRIDRDLGPDRIKDFDARRLKRIYEEWSQGGHIAMAHTLITMLRALATFGATFLKSRECRELRATLSEMQFEMPKPRKSQELTAQQINDIRAKAREMGRPSIALAQALQSDLWLRQKQVIGEWVPIAEDGSDSDVIHGGNKWVRGLRWDEIDNLVLRRGDSSRPKDIDLRLAPMVMEELSKLADIPASGPLIVSEFNGLPWTHSEFRRWWRKAADAAGVPRSVKNMDSRQRADIPQEYVSPRYRSAKRKEETEKDRPAGADLPPAGRVH
jgi:hypothetical protein